MCASRRTTRQTTCWEVIVMSKAVDRQNFRESILAHCFTSYVGRYVSMCLSLSDGAVCILSFRRPTPRQRSHIHLFMFCVSGLTKCLLRFQFTGVVRCDRQLVPFLPATIQIIKHVFSRNSWRLAIATARVCDLDPSKTNSKTHNPQCRTSLWISIQC